MPSTIVQQLAEFTANTTYDDLPPNVIEASKRIILDSVGCALAAVDQPTGKSGVAYGQFIGRGVGEATIVGIAQPVSMFGAAYANAELINALDFDAILPPGHVTPYVLPACLALSEARGRTGRQVLAAVAVAHEMSHRIGGAMDYLRDLKDGVSDPPSVYGYSSTIFGATAAVSLLNGHDADTSASALGLAGSMSPVNSHRAWTMHVPATTIKYQPAGLMSQTAFTAAHMAEFGHRGDLQILDDRRYGYPAMIGTRRWEPSGITDGLGVRWHFPADLAFKPYPHCRVLHALLDALAEIVEVNDLAPSEVDGITAWVEGFTEQPVWLTRDITDVRDAQFSIAHGLAVGAHRVEPGKQWQDPEFVFSDSVLQLMDRVKYEVHPDYAALLSDNSASRPARVEVLARGTTFVGERRYPKGSPSPEQGTELTNDEMRAKFERNATGVLEASVVTEVADSVMALESVEDFASIMRLLRPH